MYKRQSDNSVKTFVLKKKDDLAGYFELIIHKDKKEVEIAYLGLLEEYHNQKLGSLLLSSAIRNSFKEKTDRVWVHTCSLDHKNALKNYLSRGMKIFKIETISTLFNFDLLAGINFFFIPDLSRHPQFI